MNRYQQTVGQRRDELQTRLFFVIGLFFILVVYALGAVVDVMGPDAALYAEIAREMAASNNYRELYHRGEDFLDKPHMPFWLTALSFEVFGVRTFAYKLPGIFLCLVGIFYTYQLARYLHGKQVAVFATLILASSFHIVLSNSDVRAEPFLVGFIMFALYYWILFINKTKMHHLVLGAAGLSCAMMTKGIFTVIPILTGVLGYVAYHGRWQRLQDLRWFLVIPMGLGFLSPLLWAYYWQFDAQPEKWVDVHGWGKLQNISALKFYFWDSQLGRFFNTGPITGAGHPLHYLAAVLWAFMPWGIFWYVALADQGRRLLLRQPIAALALAAGLPMFVIFSASSFQLDHYLNILMPFFAIWVSHSLVHLRSNNAILAAVSGIQVGLMLLLFGYLLFLFRPPLDLRWVDVIVIAFVLAALIVLSFRQIRDNATRALYVLFFSSLAIYYFSNRIFLPELVKYQCGSQIAHYIKKQELKEGPLYIHQTGGPYFAVDFYMNTIVPRIGGDTMPSMDNYYLITSPQGLARLQPGELKTDYTIIKLAAFPNFHITRMTAAFLDKRTRSEVTSMCHLLQIRRSD